MIDNKKEQECAELHRTIGTAMIQLNRANIAINKAQELFKEAEANVTVTGTLDTIAELTADLTAYVTEEYKDAIVSNLGLEDEQ